jgi:hypothetical protein
MTLTLRRQGATVLPFIGPRLPIGPEKGRR